MSSEFLLYGSTGAVGNAIARLAVKNDLHPILAGRNIAKLRRQADELDLKYRDFELEDTDQLDAALRSAPVVLHCAGPYASTFRPMLDACLRTGTHYLDLTGEVSVFQAIANCDAEARRRAVMLLPGVGIEVAATDCLAVHLKQRLAPATDLRLAFRTQGPAPLPPGTFRTLVDQIPEGFSHRRDGQLVPLHKLRTTVVDFGTGPSKAMACFWPDVFTAYYSTRIPNIQVYAGWPEYAVWQMRFLYGIRRFLRPRFFRDFIMRYAPQEGTADELAQTRTDVWGQVSDAEGRTAISRLHGPEAGIVWTSMLALAVVRKVLAGNIRPGFTTPGLAYGPELVMECEGVTREDVL